MSIYWTLVILSLLLSYSCACNSNQPVDLTNETTQKLIASMDDFAFKIIQKLAFNPQMTMNVVLSPMSIYVSLALVLFGAAGNTQTELIKALSFPADADFQQLQQSFRDILVMNEALISKMINSQEVVDLQSHVAEGLFIQQEYPRVDTYANFLTCLNIAPQLVDFVNNMGDATNKIIQWIINNNPKSDSMAVSSTPAPGTRLFLTSIFYFTAKWEENLFSESDTVQVPFYSINNIQGQVNMMRGLSSLWYYDDKRSYTAVQIPYKGELFTAIFFLPYPQMDPIQFVTTFSIDQYQAFLNNAKKIGVDIQIPKFSSTYSMGLKEPLQEMGILTLFEQADVSNMLVTNGQTFGAEVTHNAKILVDEKGTSAVALTTVALVGATAPPQDPVSFIANHPFLMLIRNVKTNTIAFATFFYNP